MISPAVLEKEYPSIPIFVGLEVSIFDSMSDMIPSVILS